MAMWDATAMFNQFRVKCSVAGKDDEYVLFTRIGRGTKRFTINNIFWGLLKSESKFDVGDLVKNSNNESFFLVAKSSSYRASKAELYKTNCFVNVVRLVDEYDGFEIVGKTEEVIKDNCLSVFEQVSAAMKLYDVGLLKTTSMRVLIPKDIEIKLLDRLYLNEEKYQVDDVDISSFPEFYYLQLSVDARG